ncbi:MAG: YebC/PmpR family DNA-binding transcriptional regulator [Candidatus Aureabacteria bacterium]|nr:YebC/PmpR family DNA-binding transcriptional regulator [Candidatus Auribacterota bacterium]
MSGHSKWASIKHKKAAVDAKRGNLFTKIIREISVAARNGGSDPVANPSLRTAIAKAKEANMPSDNIQRAIKKGTGELEGVTYEDLQFEAFGPEGIGILIKALTDNKNRTSSEIKTILSKRGGSLAAQGAVAYMFKRKGYFEIPFDTIKEDDLFMLVTDAGAENFSKEDDAYYEVTCTPENFENLRSAMEKCGVKCSKAEIAPIPDTRIPVNDAASAKKLMEMIDALEEHDDIQNVYDNSDIPDAIMAQI